MSKIIKINEIDNNEDSSYINSLKYKNKINEIFREIIYNEIIRVNEFPYNRRSERFLKINNISRTAISATILKRNNKNIKYLYPIFIIYGKTGNQY